ncbi:MAG: TolC family protein [Planctomycetota bacterium]|nr:TolC family protein [Planctomycetota bacterium]
MYDLDFEESVRKALAQNPSFQTERDRYEDQRRSFLISLYNLRIAPRISFSYNVPLVDENSEDFENHNSSLTASISWSYNLDQESRKDAYRNLLQSWTIYERDFKRRQDEIVKEVRRQVRAVDNALRSMRNAERSYETSIKKREGAELDYENNNISAAEYNDALNAVTDAWDSLNRARVNYKVEVLRYFSLIGELKIDDRGEWLQ